MVSQLVEISSGIVKVLYPMFFELARDARDSVAFSYPVEHRSCEELWCFRTLLIMASASELSIIFLKTGSGSAALKEYARF